MGDINMSVLLENLIDEYDAHVSDTVKYCMAYEDREGVEWMARAHSVACRLFGVPWHKVAEILDMALLEPDVDCGPGLSDSDRQGVEWFSKLCRGDVDLADHADHGFDISTDEDADDD